MRGNGYSIIIIASISLIASVLTASLSYYFAKKHERLSNERRLKEEFYRQFIEALNDVVIDSNDNNSQVRLSKAFNSLLLISSADVIQRLMDFHDFLRTDVAQKSPVPRDSKEWLIKHDDILNELIKAMRIDLFGAKKYSGRDFPRVHLVGGRGKPVTPS